MTKLLLDMGLPRRTAEDLTADGWDATHVAAEGMRSSPDESLIEFAGQHRRTIVTLDEDFARLAATSGKQSPSVVLIRMQGLNRARATDLIQRVVTAIRDDIEHGCIASVTPNGIRVRRLPIG